MEDIKAIVDRIISTAKRRFDNPVFVFGDEVYTIEEARQAMIEHGEEDMEMYGLSVEAYEVRQLECCSENG